MRIRELRVPDAYEFTPTLHKDDRGAFLEYFRAQDLREACGRELELAQANCSVSARGVVRGVHFAEVPPGQAKYVHCPFGAVLDVVVDFRVGSPTYGTWDAVRLDDEDRQAVYVPEGLGHAFMALSDGAVVTYLSSQPYSPAREHGVHPLDPDLDIRWPRDVPPVLSAKDASAPDLEATRRSGILPSYETCRALYAR